MNYRTIITVAVKMGFVNCIALELSQNTKYGSLVQHSFSYKNGTKKSHTDNSKMKLISII